MFEADLEMVNSVSINLHSKILLRKRVEKEPEFP